LCWRGCRYPGAVPYWVGGVVAVGFTLNTADNPASASALFASSLPWRTQAHAQKRPGQRIVYGIDRQQPKVRIHFPEYRDCFLFALRCDPNGLGGRNDPQLACATPDLAVWLILDDILPGIMRGISHV